MTRFPTACPLLATALSLAAAQAMPAGGALPATIGETG